jgi:hypothetical protein
VSFIFQSHWHGKFGNRMHQYAYGATYKRLHNVEYWTHSAWEGNRLFKTPENKVYELPETEFSYKLNMGSVLGAERDEVVSSHFLNIKKVDSLLSPSNYNKYDHPIFFDSLSAYNDSVFEPMDRDHLLKVFEFSDEVKNTEAYKYWSNKAGTYDIAHLRRDDIANAEFNRANIQGYSVVSKESYMKAFKQYGFDPEAMEWTSDDYLNKWHTDRPQSPRLTWSYPAGAEYREDIVFDWLEDFLRLYFARTIFRANSSFSWWAAFLSPTATVYSPILDTQLIYGRDDKYEEIETEFAMGNEPHWMYLGTASRCITI